MIKTLYKSVVKIMINITQFYTNYEIVINISYQLKTAGTADTVFSTSQHSFLFVTVQSTAISRAF